MATAKPPRKKKASAPTSGPRGLEPAQLADSPPAAIVELSHTIESEGGKVLSAYRDPLGGFWQVLAGLPIDSVDPTPFQRDLSKAHAQRLTGVLDRLDRYLDPIVVVRSPEGRYWTPNGLHRLTAMRALGARTIVALVIPEFDLCFKILALNTEKAHNVKDRALEVVRMARALAKLGSAAESQYALEFEEPAFLTLGVCWEREARFSGGAYAPILRKTDQFFDLPLVQTLETREVYAETLLQIDAVVSEIVKALKARGLDSPYLRAFAVARVNPLRHGRGGDLPTVLAAMLASAEGFDAGSVKESDVAGAGGAPTGAEDD